MENELEYLAQLAIRCPSDKDDIYAAIDLIKAENYDALLQMLLSYSASTPCKTDLAACMDRILLGVNK